jgi:Asp-tRNA(Asn)/Glu-tRNA(Gln) amidotransferase A subunit family amidase
MPAGLPADFNPEPQPYGISFAGKAFSEPVLIEIAHAFEQVTRGRTSPASAPPLRKDVKGNKHR